MQHENAQHLIELEEIHMKLEKKQLEKEAQQQREEQEFQLRMMQVMMGTHMLIVPLTFIRGHQVHLENHRITHLSITCIHSLLIMIVFNHYCCIIINHTYPADHDST